MQEEKEGWTPPHTEEKIFVPAFIQQQLKTPENYSQYSPEHLTNPQRKKFNN